MSRLLTKFISAWQLVARRSLAHWRILSWVTIGVLLASTMMAGTAIYFEALRELALKHVLSTHAPHDLDILATYDHRPSSRQEYEHVSAISSGQFESRLGWLLQGRVGAVKTDTVALTAPDDEDLAGADDNRAFFAYAPRLEQFARLLPGGRMPEAPQTKVLGEPPVLEAIVPVEAAELLDVRVGDTISAVPFIEVSSPYARVVITGLFERRDPTGDFWHFYGRAIEAGTLLTVRTLPLFVSEGAYFDLLGPSFGSLESRYAWLLDVDTARLNAANSPLASSSIEQTLQWVNVDLPGYRLSTVLLSVLDDYDKRLFFTKVPMFMFFVLISVVIFYYIITLSSLLVDRQRGEVALLRSRGASAAQILSVFVLEGATLAVIAAAAGPLIAAGGISVMGLTPAFSDLSGGSLLSVKISGGAYMMSGAGAVLSFAALMFAAIRASRVGVTRHRQESARPASQPAFQKYYLDVLLLVASILLFRQLSEQGSVLATGLFGEVAVNQMLLAAPAMVLVAAATILLRLYPLAMRLISGLFARRSSAGLALGLWQMSRNPTHYARVSLLLILTAGLGVFSASFVATLERSFEERVLYATGSDIRVEGLQLKTTGLRKNVKESYTSSFTAVEIASPAYRGRGSDIGKPQGRSFTVLAVDRETFLQVAWIRDDFSGEPIGDVLDSLKLPDSSGDLLLPEKALTIGVVLKASTADPDIWVTARIKDANDRYASYRLGPLALPDYLGNLKKPTWRDMDAALDAGHRIAAPLTLVSLGVHANHSRGRLPRGSVLIDEITIGYMEKAGTDIKTEVVESFDDADGWSTLQLTPSAHSDDLTEETSSDRDSGLVRFAWNTDEPMIGHGIFYSPGLPRLPVMASKSFMRDLGYSKGDEALISVKGRTIPVQLVDSIELFPTLNPFRERFLLADLASLKRYANLDPLGDEFQANEVWLSLKEGEIDRPHLLTNLPNEPFKSGFIQDRQRLLEDFQVDPLARAGWSALLFVAFAAVLALSCMGFLVHTFASFREREPQFAIMRSVGLAMRQLVTLVWIEQVMVIAAGMAMGTWMGARLVGTIMPFLAHDERGIQVVPPFAVEVDWGALLMVYAAMALIFAVIMAGAIWFVFKISLQRVLRMGEV